MEFTTGMPRIALVLQNLPIEDLVLTYARYVSMLM